ncbi:type II toxin-antitoxin system prevent-host-death family antitoxin [Nonomuraea sp. NPDC004297]
MSHSDSSTPAAPDTAPTDPTDATTEEASPAAGPELGIREARGQLGELVNRAHYRDEVTYLTKHRTRVAAVVPAEAARTRAQSGRHRRAVGRRVRADAA